MFIDLRNSGCRFILAHTNDVSPKLHTDPRYNRDCFTNIDLSKVTFSSIGQFIVLS